MLIVARRFIHISRWIHYFLYKRISRWIHYFLQEQCLSRIFKVAAESEQEREAWREPRKSVISVGCTLKETPVASKTVGRRNGENAPKWNPQSVLLIPSKPWARVLSRTTQNEITFKRDKRIWSTQARCKLEISFIWQRFNFVMYDWRWLTMQLAIGSANDRSRVEKIYRSFHVCGTVFVRSKKTKKKKKKVIPRAHPSSSASLDNFQSSDREKRLKEVQLRKCPTNVPWIRFLQSVDSISSMITILQNVITRTLANQIWWTVNNCRWARI